MYNLYIQLEFLERNSKNVYCSGSQWTPLFFLLMPPLGSQNSRLIGLAFLSLLVFGTEWKH